MIPIIALSTNKNNLNHIDDKLFDKFFSYTMFGFIILFGILILL